MPSKADRPVGRRLLANLTRLARTVRELEQRGHDDPDARERLRRVVPALAEALTDVVDADKPA